MNKELFDYLDILISSGTDHYEKVTNKQKKVILGYILLDSEEPINFLVETDCHKRLMHTLINYLISPTDAQFTSILDIYCDIENGAMQYHEERMKEAFNEVKESLTLPYPSLNGVDYYEDTRGV